MKGLKHHNIKLVIVIISVLLIGYAWIYYDTTVSIIGAIMYLLGMCFDIIDLILKSKQFKKGQVIIGTKKPIEKFVSVLEAILVISSLFAVFLDNNLYHIPGRIIWFGQVVVFVLVGPLVQSLTNIPLEMTYGGWRVHKFRRNK